MKSKQRGRNSIQRKAHRRRIHGAREAEGGLDAEENMSFINGDGVLGATEVLDASSSLMYLPSTPHPSPPSPSLSSSSTVTKEPQENYRCFVIFIYNSIFFIIKMAEEFREIEEFASLDFENSRNFRKFENL